MRVMKTNRIAVTTRDEKLNFYLVSDVGRFYLFSQPFTKGVHDYFRREKTENEIRAFKGWNRNPRLDKTIQKLPMYIRYCTRYLMNEAA